LLWCEEFIGSERLKRARRAVMQSDILGITCMLQRGTYYNVENEEPRSFEPQFHNYEPMAK